MSTLSMILTVAMVVPAIGPEKDSGDVVQESRPLDLRGEWKGEWWLDKHKRFEVTSVGSDLFAKRGSAVTLIDTTGIIDEGDGRLRGEWLFANNGIHGIYKWYGERLVICFSRCPDPRPTSFAVDDKRCLLILHRVKPVSVRPTAFLTAVVQCLPKGGQRYGPRQTTRATQTTTRTTREPTLAT